VKFPGATRLVICCKGHAIEAMQVMRQLMGRLRLTINEEKTHYCRVPREHFDFLGYTFGRYYPPYSGRAYLSARPSKKSVRRQIESIREKTAKRRTLLPADQIVTELNDGLRGWANYFSLGPVEDAYRAIESYVTRRLRRWLCIKHEVRGSGCYRFTDQYLHETLGLVRIRHLVHHLPWANA